MNQQALPNERQLLPDPVKRPVLTAAEVFELLGIDRSTGYQSIRNGSFPLPVIRIGRIIRVPTAAVCRLLTTGSADRPNTEAA